MHESITYASTYPTPLPIRRSLAHHHQHPSAYQQLLSIGVDLAGLLLRRMASAEGGSVPSGVEYGDGCPLPSRLGLENVVSSPQRGRGEASVENGFWRILKATERSFLYLHDKI